MFLFALIATSYAQNLTQVFSANETYTGVKTINVTADFSKVLVEKGSAITLATELMANKDLEGYEVNVSQEADVLNIAVMKPKSGWTSHSGFVNLTVPDGVNLSVKSGSGYITVKGLTANNVKAEAKSGKINVSNVIGDYNLRTTSASITVENVEGKLVTKSKGGSQVVRQINGSASLVTYSGSILAEQINGVLSTETTDGTQTLKDVEGDVKMKTKSGALKLSDAKGTFYSLSNAGTLNLFNVNGVFDLNSTKGAVIGNRVKMTASSSFKTTEGKIKLKLDHDKSELSFLCESEKGMIVVYGKAKKKKNKFGKGPIVVTTFTSTGAQSFY